jgi:hypothetical protein
MAHLGLTWLTQVNCVTIARIGQETLRLKAVNGAE